MKSIALTPRQKQQLTTASILGNEAYANKMPRIPQMDKELRKMIDGRAIGFTPENELPTSVILQLWLENYDAALEMSMLNTIK